MPERVELYQARDGWRWRRVAINEKIVSESGEAYENKLHAIRMAKQLNQGVAVYEIEVTTSGGAGGADP